MIHLSVCQCEGGSLILLSVCQWEGGSLYSSVRSSVFVSVRTPIMNKSGQHIAVFRTEHMVFSQTDYTP